MSYKKLITFIKASEIQKEKPLDIDSYGAYGDEEDEDETLLRVNYPEPFH